MRKIALLTILIFSLASLAHAAAGSQPSAASPLEGSKWTVKVTPDKAAMDKGEKVFDDTLIFEDGKVSMTECVKVGFAASSYSTSKMQDHWMFKTDQMSEKEGKSAWTAQIKGDTIKGKMQWTKKDGTVLSYSFEGKKSM